MTSITNKFDIPLLLGAWLLNDNYDYVKDPKYISATGIMRPIQQIVLTPLVPKEDWETPDLSDYIARSLGNSVHDAVEGVWTNREKLEKTLGKLGYSKGDIQNIEVNPEKPDPTKHQVYIEQRSFKKLMGYTIGGKFDAVLGGIVHDIKTTSAWAWAKGTRDDDFILQGSIYRWLNPEIITEDFIRVCFLFTDWQAGQTAEGYPDARCKYKDLPLMSLAETEKWLKKRLTQIIAATENHDLIPACTEEELWLKPPVHKYFSDPTKVSGRSTKNFTDLSEANKYLLEKGKGIIISDLPVANRCKYCNAYPICPQKDNYVID